MQAKATYIAMKTDVDPHGMTTCPICQQKGFLPSMETCEYCGCPIEGIVHMVCLIHGDIEGKIWHWVLPVCQEGDCIKQIISHFKEDGFFSLD